MLARTLFLTFLLMAFSVATFAHAVVIRSSLESAAPAPNRAGEVHLWFNSDIEPALSLFLLVRSGDHKQVLPFAKGRGRGEVVVTLPPLPPGEYALQYKVFAADGHLTESIVQFFVREEN